MRVIRLLVTEGLFLGLAAGALGLVLTLGALELFEGQRLLSYLPALQPIEVDGRVLGFALTLSLLTGVLFSVVPGVGLGVRTGSVDLVGSRIAAGRSRLRAALVVTQVGLSLALVTAAGLLLDTVRALRAVELGFEPRGVLEATVDPGTHGYQEAETAAFWNGLLERTRRAPGVRAAGLAWAPLHGPIASGFSVTPEGAGEESTQSANNNYVSEGFIDAVGLRLVSGRDFLPEERLAEAPRDVLIVSESLAAALFARESAVGRRVTVSHRSGQIFEIVGVIEDPKLHGAADDEARSALLPLGLKTWATLYAKGAGTAAEIEAPVRDAVASIDPTLPLYDVQPLSSRVAQAMSEERVLAMVTTLFASLALVLAGVGLYGMMTQMVNARWRELGIRIALGASRADVRGSVLGAGARATGIGLVVGAGCAYVTSRLVASRLWGVGPFDPRVLSSAILVLLGAAALACWLPARRATRSDAVEVLGSD